MFFLNKNTLQPNTIDIAYGAVCFLALALLLTCLISLIIHFNKSSQPAGRAIALSGLIFINTIVIGFSLTKVFKMLLPQEPTITIFKFFADPITTYGLFMVAFLIDVVIIATYALRPKMINIFNYEINLNDEQNSIDAEAKTRQEKILHEREAKKQAAYEKHMQEEMFRRKRVTEAARKRKILEEAAKKRAKIKKEKQNTKSKTYTQTKGARRNKQPINDILYRYLGLQLGASNEEIKRNYRMLAKKYHPDVSSDPKAAEKFLRVQKAYNVLSDPKRKLLYDVEGVYTE